MTASQKYVPLRAANSVRRLIRDVDYHLLEWGDASRPALFLLHGWGDCAASFQFLVDKLSDRWFVVAPDWRGFGRTTTRQQSYWFPDYLADLDAMLAHYRPDDAVHLVGHSMGANIAGLYAGIFPQRVATFVNIEGFGLPRRGPEDAPDNYRRFITQARRLTPYADYPSLAALAARVHKRAPRASEQVALTVAANWGREDDQGRVVLRADPAHRLPNATLYRREEAEACWAQIRARLLLIAGAESEFADGANAFKAACQSLTGETVELILPECGHMVHLEAATSLALAIEQFITGET